MYSMTQGINRAGGFIWLGVSNLERKRFCIFIPRGRRDKRGWMIMAEKLHQLVGVLGRKLENQEVKAVGKAVLGRSYATVVKRPLSGNPNVIVVKAKREESIGLLQKLEYCVVVSWKDNSGGEEDFEKLGQFWAKSWDLKGNLGLAKLEKERVLLEFEDLEEARRVVSSGNRAMGGIQVGLEHWSPRSGCWAEEEERKEVWVRIVGLPISLWSPVILKRVGDECSDFITVDEQTKTMGELQWARILVKSRGEFRPSVLEFEVEEEVYVVSLWWECRLVLRRNRSQEAGRQSIEVRGEGASCAEQRVAEERVRVRLETLNSSDEWTGEQGVESGLAKASQDLIPTTWIWASTSKSLHGSHTLNPIAGPKETRRVGGLGLANGFWNVDNGAVWVFTGVYDPFSKVERDELWEESGAIRGLWEDPWCLGGDSNITLFLREMSSQRRISSAMRKFAEIVDDLGLVDFHLQGGEFTWNEGHNNQAWARLDRFLVSPS
ncbi:hypothetical protein VitviT2T_019820 [Vitis vinifera]|uniref:DUF4283 domain-containing protein n=1 Tax=Vitis vinifera TaxID=29760 RepID=A0ABY9D3N2_VITVI|nr:hypothetical protein VitviT2T_019820 [Vitis vinifera]